MAAKSKTSSELKKWTNEMVLSYWQKPDLRDIIINALPLESLFYNEDEGSKEELSTTPKYEESSTTHSVAKPSMQKPRHQVHATSAMSEETIIPTAPPDKVMFRDLWKAIQPVDPQLLRHPPFQAVGKLFWFVPGTRDIMYWASAFYIGKYENKNKLLTVAHAFESETCNYKGKDYEIKEKAGIFVPAMINKYDIYGNNYGHYPVENARSHPLYEHSIWTKHGRCLKTPQYDICVITLGQGNILPEDLRKETPTKGSVNKLGESPEFENIELELKELVPSFKNQFKRLDTLGYGMKEGGGKENDGSDGGKMSIVTGWCEERRKTNNNGQPQLEDECIVTSPALPFGMSGGPRIPPGSLEAVGCQSGSDFKGKKSYSPHFTEELLERVGITVTKSPASNPPRSPLLSPKKLDQSPPIAITQLDSL